MSKVEFMKCHPEHILYIAPEAMEENEYFALLTPQAAEALASSVALSAWYGGKCLGAGGVLQHWSGRGEAWLVTSRYARPHIMAVISKLRFVLETIPVRRIEMVVKREHEKGHRLARMLGFEVETECMRGYGMKGEDATMYVRLKP